MLNVNPKLYSISKAIFFMIVISYANSSKSDSLNECMKKALQNKVSMNKILTLCRENINPVDVYSNDYKANNNNNNVESNYISTNKMDKIINELIDEGDLNKASRLAERQEMEKTKRIKARAEAEALRSPQIIATHNNTNTEKDTNNSNVRSTLALGSNPISSISAGSKVLQITTTGAHGAIPGQYVQLSNASSAVDGIAASEINKFHVISSVPSVTTFTISVLTAASAGSVSGGGSDIIAIFQN